MKQHDASNRNVYFLQQRYQTVSNALYNMNDNDSMNFARNILSGEYGFVCQYKKDLNFDTIWSSIFDITGNK